MRRQTTPTARWRGLGAAASHAAISVGVVFALTGCRTHLPYTLGANAQCELHSDEMALQARQANAMLDHIARLESELLLLTRYAVEDYMDEAKRSPELAKTVGRLIEYLNKYEQVLLNWEFPLLRDMNYIWMDDYTVQPRVTNASRPFLPEGTGVGSKAKGDAAPTE